MDLSAFPTPEGFTKPTERVISEQSAKFTDGQANAAGFAGAHEAINSYDRQPYWRADIRQRT